MDPNQYKIIYLMPILFIALGILTSFSDELIHTTRNLFLLSFVLTILIYCMSH